jgi:S-adenosylmethionine synthetase
MGYLFTSESVTEGHPDKICDNISDAVLDAVLTQDARARVACETLVKTGFVVLAGEITTKAKVNFADIARATIRDIGYTSSDMGFDAGTCAVLTAIEAQSPDISQGVTQGEGLYKEQGAGDQGLMFGFAVDETPELMPAPVSYAHKLAKRLSEVRKNGKLAFLRPDGKTQVTVEYDENQKPLRIDAVVVSSQHSEDVKHKRLKEAVLEEVVLPTLPERLIDKKTKFWINPTGRFVLGGPYADVFHGGGGNDYLQGNGGNDHLCGGTDSDEVKGNEGTDNIHGGPGHDALYGGYQADRIAGGKGEHDLIAGMRGHDTLLGQEGDDTIHDGYGNDSVSSGPGQEDRWYHCITEYRAGEHDTSQANGSNWEYHTDDSFYCEP